MEPVEYDETIHPVVWLNKIKSCCYKNQITKKEDIIEFCKSMVHPSIDVSKASTFDEILNILKTDVLFTLFKYSVEEKLQKLKFDPKNEDHVQFISIFRKFCYEAEINDVEKQKKLLLKLSKDSFQYYFINNNLEKIKSLDDLVVYFNQSFLEQRKFIHFGSCITLKHVATGKYLTSCNVHYKTGSKRSIVHVNENIVISGTYKSPSTGNWEASCILSRHMHFIEIDSTNNDDTYIKSKEIINIRDMEYNNYILRNHEFPDNETYQDVVGHKGRVDEHDKWCIE
ncbi:hypothetical protein RhiirA4_472568 [Rhizophagus irregularis]|uniref:MIR domain-containing protein n=1 Tax=Rhizophagus irregularis TaxID=588596 RepID=A0A2I1H566_9GLOM|nr:hypothetical protein RhiirA4_472568 [Rhizophagus irregularis]